MRKKSNFEKKLSGEKRKQRYERPPWTIPFEKIPRAPSHLDKEAKKFWRKYSDLCIQIGSLDQASLMLFEILCSQVARAKECQAYIKENGAFYKTETGFVRENPAVKLLRETSKIIQNLAKDFGLAIKDRKTMEMKFVDEEENEIEEYLGRKFKKTN